MASNVENVKKEAGSNKENQFSENEQTNTLIVTKYFYFNLVITNIYKTIYQMITKNVFGFIVVYIYVACGIH